MGCQWGCLIALTKLGTPEAVGQFAIALAVSAPVLMFTNLQLRAVQATDARSAFEFSHYCGLRVLTTAAGFAVVAAIAAVAYSGATTLAVILMGLARSMDALSDVVYGMLQRREQMRYIAVSSSAKGLLALALFTLGAALGGVVWAVAGMAAAWGLVFLAYDAPLARRIAGPGLWTQLRAWNVFARLVRLSLPLGFVMMVLSLNQNIPRYFLERLQGDRELGLFAAVAYLPLAGSAVINSLSQAITPRLANYYAAPDARGFVRLIARASLLGGLLGLALVAVFALAGDELVTRMYSKQYSGHQDTVVLLMTAGAINFVAAFLGCGATAARYFRVQMPMLAAVAATMVAGCLAWVPAQGAHGAAWAMVAAALVQLALCFAIVYHAVRRINSNA